AGFRKPTALAGGNKRVKTNGERYATHSVSLSAGITEALQSTARGLRVTINSLVQGVWSLLLNRQTGCKDVVFGASYAGRPVELPGADSVVGPFVNNLPVRVSVENEALVSGFVKELHNQSLE